MIQSRYSNRSIMFSAMFLGILLLLLYQPKHHAQSKITLIVFAASSLTDAMDDIAEDFESLYPNIDLEFNFAGSSTLATQIEQGAPADVFASANTTQMKRLISENYVDSTSIFAYNSLALIVPRDNPASISSIFDLANKDISIVFAAKSVPVREYTDRFLQSVASQETTADDFLTAINANIVSEEANVRQVLFKIELGEADAGIVYRTDVNENVLSIPIPNFGNVLAAYPIAITADSPHQDEAQLFIDFLLSTQGQRQLVDAGFIPSQILKNIGRDFLTQTIREFID